jgi:hypothetical protein
MRKMQFQVSGFRFKNDESSTLKLRRLPVTSIIRLKVASVMGVGNGIDNIVGFA